MRKKEKRKKRKVRKRERERELKEKLRKSRVTKTIPIWLAQDTKLIKRLVLAEEPGFDPMWFAVSQI